MTRKLRILQTEASTGFGGEELRVLADAEGMLRRGHNVVLAVPVNSTLWNEAERKGLPVIRLNMVRHRMPALMLEFLRIIREYGIQIVNTHGSLDSWAASIAARLSSIKPIVIRSRHKSLHVSDTFRHRVLYGALPHGIIATGEVVRQHLIDQLKVPPDRIWTIPTGIDMRLFQPGPRDGRVRQELGLSAKQVVVGTVAFLRRYKGVDYLIEAVHALAPRYPDLRTLIVGDGPEREALVAKVKSLGLDDRVIFAGHRDDVPEIMASLDIFVLTSVDTETLPQTIRQAMAMERAVIATSVGSVADVVKDRETGFLIPPRDVPQLTHAIAELAQDRQLRERLGKAGRALVADRYSLEQMLDETEEVCCGLLDRRLDPITMAGTR
jgi:glycosyltransferase involved in cell wall biosynthesis